MTVYDITCNMALRLSSFVTLQVSKLRINDTGTYQCFVATKEGADYKMIILSVKGSYRVCEGVTFLVVRQRLQGL